MGTYFIMSDSDYLMHHGVKGQKWGVRRFQNYDGTWKDAGKRLRNYSNKALNDTANSIGVRKDIKRLKTRVGIARNYRLMENVRAIHNVKNAKGIGAKASELMGHGRAANKAHYKALAEQKRAEKVSRNDIDRHIHEVRAKNYESVAKYHKDVQSMSLGRRVIEHAVPIRAFQTKITSISGRESTVGKEMALRTLTHGAGNLALDAIYLAKKAKS